MPYNFPHVEKVVLKLKKSNLDNLVDRAHYFLTVALLSMFALMNAGNLLFGSPIQCMVPAEYGEGWASFVNQYCFITSTYVDEGGGFNPDPNSPKIDLGYYPWFAYVLFAQSLIFYLPHFLWTWAIDKGDVDVQGVVDHSVKSRSELNPCKKDKTVNKSVSYLFRVFKRRVRDSDPGDGLGDKATFFYLASKGLNLVNVYLQLHLITSFVGRGRIDWGFKVLRDAFNGIFWDQHGFFPRLSTCIFPREDLAHTTIKEAQCVLIMNMVNEKIFAFLYFWFLLLSALTFADLLYQLGVYLCDRLRLYTAKRYLANIEKIAPNALATGKRKEAFVMEVLGRDGLLLLQFIEAHAGILVASQVACRLFELVDEDERRNAIAGGDDNDDNFDDGGASIQLAKNGPVMMGQFA